MQCDLGHTSPWGCPSLDFRGGKWRYKMTSTATAAAWSGGKDVTRVTAAAAVQRAVQARAQLIWPAPAGQSRAARRRRLFITPNLQIYRFVLRVRFFYHYYIVAIARLTGTHTHLSPCRGFRLLFLLCLAAHHTICAGCLLPKRSSIVVFSGVYYPITVLGLSDERSDHRCMGSVVPRPEPTYYIISSVLQHWHYFPTFFPIIVHYYYACAMNLFFSPGAGGIIPGTQQYYMSDVWSMYRTHSTAVNYMTRPPYVYSSWTYTGAVYYYLVRTAVIY